MEKRIQYDYNVGYQKCSFVHVPRSERGSIRLKIKIVRLHNVVPCLQREICEGGCWEARRKREMSMVPFANATNRCVRALGMNEGSVLDDDHSTWVSISDTWAFME